MNKLPKHYEENIVITATSKEIFDYADNHANFSSHMNKSSWMMGGGKMETKVDEEHFQKIGSHIRMGGDVLGIKLFLDEVVTVHEPPFRKTWETVGDLNLLIIGNYQLGFEITPENNNSKFKVFIDYELPQSWKTYWLGVLLGKFYAKWCVKQMIDGVKARFNQ